MNDDRHLDFKLLREWVVPYFEILLPSKTIHEPTRNERFFRAHFV